MAKKKPSNTDISKLRSILKDEKQKFDSEEVNNWVNIRPGSFSEKDRIKLDAYTRLSSLQLENDVTRKLADTGGIKSLYQLGRLSKKQLADLAQNTGVDKAQVMRAAIQAQRKTVETTQLLIAAKSLAASNPGSGGPGDLFDGSIDPDLVATGNECNPCPDNVSIFSCLAYLIYLIKKTGKSLTELKSLTSLDFRNLNAANLEDLTENPQIPCEKITLCQRMTRALHDLLDELQLEPATALDGADYRYLSLSEWKSTKMALTYPELNALWRGDVLTGETGGLSYGSFLENQQDTREHLFEELGAVQAALDVARVFPLQELQQGYEVSPTLPQFNSAQLFRDAHPDRYRSFLEGMEVIRQTLLADEAIVDAQKMLSLDDAGNSLFSLQKAVQHLDLAAGLTFGPTSAWKNFASTADDPYQGLISLAPEERQEALKLLFHDLMEGKKPLFAPINEDISIVGLFDDGTISLETGWKYVGFGNTDGKLQKRESDRASFVRYAQDGTDFDRFTNCSLSAELKLGELLEEDEKIGLAIHWHPEASSVLSKKGYMLAITRTIERTDGGGFAEDGWVDDVEDFFGEEEDTTTYRDFLNLFKIEESNNGEIVYTNITDPVLIGYLSRGPGAANRADKQLLNDYETYPMSLRITGTRLEGEIWANNKLIAIKGEDASYPNGTFGFFGSEKTRFSFENVQFDVESAASGTEVVLLFRPVSA